MNRASVFALMLSVFAFAAVASEGETDKKTETDAASPETASESVSDNAKMSEENKSEAAPEAAVKNDKKANEKPSPKAAEVKKNKPGTEITEKLNEEEIPTDQDTSKEETPASETENK